MLILFGQMVFIMGALIISRTDNVPEIKPFNAVYLPGAILADEVGNKDCFDLDFAHQTCIGNVAGQKIYFIVDRNSRMISGSAIRADEYRIGDLIRTWGYPTGFRNSDGPVTVYWGTRSAIIYAKPVRPESEIDFIQYDLESQPAEAWQGFKLPAMKGDQ
jgi:hypothetical protein